MVVARPVFVSNSNGTASRVRTFPRSTASLFAASDTMRYGVFAKKLVHCRRRQSLLDAVNRRLILQRGHGNDVNAFRQRIASSRNVIPASRDPRRRTKNKSNLPPHGANSSASFTAFHIESYGVTKAIATTSSEYKIAFPALRSLPQSGPAEA